ncbi:hypothetical protein BSK47_29575 [Paenibacillus odorifer]|uniref:Uncharacterized protein n=1 Tax=Paenibacillus odorifer TaxID=189426 RepID=A0AB36J611_9BACL|nr:hypothetical protein BSK47_29575 [Paenibacillus odorifer]
MTLSWGTPLKPKYLSFVFGSGWEKGDFKLFSVRKVPLGWDMNIWRISVSYDNYGKVKPR